MSELEIPMFNKGDIVTDKFSNLFEIYDMVFTERFNQNAPGYDKMGYRLKLIGNHTSSPVRMVGNVAGFYNTGEVLWIYNTKEDAEHEEIRVTEDHLFATELSLYDNPAKAEDSDEIEHSDELEVPAFRVGNLVKDKFGNIYKIKDIDDAGNSDNMRYKLALFERNSDSPVRKVGNVSGFYSDDKCAWIYNTFRDAASDEVLVTEDHIFATELELVKPATPAKAEKAEITKRYPSIEDLQKISEENDLGNLLDQAYKILKEQASLGERRSNLEAETFKRCIPHFEREGFDITEHGTLIEVRW